MKYFEKIAGAEAREMARIVARIAKNKKKANQLVEGTVKVIPSDKKAVAAEQFQTGAARSRTMLGSKSIKFPRTL